MERKRADLCCLLIVLLSGQQQQVAAGFCECYKDCYSHCRSTPGGNRSLCGFVCFTACPFAKPPRTSAGNCVGICRQLSICGMAATGPADVDACVNDCTTKNLGADALTAANLN